MSKKYYAIIIFTINIIKYATCIKATALRLQDLFFFLVEYVCFKLYIKKKFLITTIITIYFEKYKTYIIFFNKNILHCY